MTFQKGRCCNCFYVLSSINFLRLPFIGVKCRYDHSTGHAIYVVLSVLLFHFIITGAVLATCCW